MRKKRELVRIVDFEFVHGGNRIDNDSAVRRFTGRANNFLMIFVANQDDGAIFTGKFQGFEMYLCNQRTSGVNHFEGARFGFIANRRRNSVRAENQHRTVRNLVNGFHEDCAAPAKLFHDIRVMNDFVMDVNWRAVSFQRQLDNIHRAHNSSAEASRPHP